IKGLEMSGGEYLQALRITLANGDVTRIEFENSAAVSELPLADRMLFGAP
ncbi:MAG TPA: outer membrane lipoprotein carrier protein LolA, partial [Caballeronia sp.]|nr:outer membrane lipoprotein carrier protein LolA [Caballeronia sp.]